MLLALDGRRALSERDVAKVCQWKHGHINRGAAWGLGVGSAVGAALSAAGVVESTGACNCATLVLTTTGAFAAIGAAIGVVTAARVHEEVIFFRPGIPPAAVTVSPLLTRSRRGVLVTVGF